MNSIRLRGYEYGEAGADETAGLCLYRDSFDPAKPLEHVVRCDDVTGTVTVIPPSSGDPGSVRTEYNSAKLPLDLTTERCYVAVVTVEPTLIRQPAANSTPFFTFLLLTDVTYINGVQEPAPVQTTDAAACAALAPTSTTTTQPAPSSTTSSTTTTAPATTTTTAAGATSTSTTITGDAPGISLSRSEAVPGQTLTVTGAGFQPQTAVVIELHSTPVQLASTTADADGRLSAVVTIPASTAPGAHQIVVVGIADDGTNRTLRSALAVTAAPSSLARTGGGDYRCCWLSERRWPCSALPG